MAETEFPINDAMIRAGRQALLSLKRSKHEDELVADIYRAMSDARPGLPEALVEFEGIVDCLMVAEKFAPVGPQFAPGNAFQKKYDRDGRTAHVFASHRELQMNPFPEQVANLAAARVAHAVKIAAHG